jgi:hypothetical protein
MPYAKSLRVIGQSLEVARVTTFELEKDRQDYLIRSDSLTQTSDWILRNAIGESDFTEQSGHRSTVNRPLRFTPVDISRLDSQRQKQRRTHSSSQTQGSSKLSQLLRSLGDHLDRTEVSAFHILWTPDSVCVDYQESDGQSDSRTFTAEKLQQLGLHSRFRRSSIFRYGIPVPKKHKDV